VGHEVAIGEKARIIVTMPDPRCVMTTLAQEDLPKDTNILRALTRYNRIHINSAGLFPCAGVYAVVKVPGSLRCGDKVLLH
jgi:uncharacterized protein YcbX